MTGQISLMSNQPYIYIYLFVHCSKFKPKNG